VRGGNQDTIVARTQSRGFIPRRAVTQSGGFTVKDGMIVTDSMTEPEVPGAGPVISTSTSENGISRTLAQVFTTDLIVQGSACVGVDCSSSESFGFDTIRLKENNLRIKFQDTSTSGSFPSNDWQLTANETNNGGKNMFAIDDVTGGRTPFTVEASAPSNSIYVEDGGNVGFGTSTPVVDLHAVSGNTPTLRLEQDGSSGFTAQTWDLAGNEANFFIRDVTHSSNLPFRIKPGSGNDDALYIAADGDIGLGKDNPSASLDIVAGTDATAISATTSSGTDAVITLVRPDGATNFMSASGSHGFFGTTTDHPVRINANGTWRMQLNTDNSLSMQSGATCTTGGVWTSVSSREAKENIKNLTSDEAIKALKGLTPVEFNYKAEKDEKYVGFIAEDVPELVATKDRKRLTSMDIVAVLTKVVQEQQKTISQLKEKMAKLEKNSK
jgi:hypothetical protein